MKKAIHFVVGVILCVLPNLTAVLLLRIRQHYSVAYGGEASYFQRFIYDCECGAVIGLLLIILLLAQFFFNQRYHWNWLVPVSLLCNLLINQIPFVIGGCPLYLAWAYLSIPNFRILVVAMTVASIATSLFLKPRIKDTN